MSDWYERALEAEEPWAVRFEQLWGRLLPYLIAPGDYDDSEQRAGEYLAEMKDILTRHGGDWHEFARDCLHISAAEADDLIGKAAREPARKRWLGPLPPDLTCN
jgi:hypothetical protein